MIEHVNLHEAWKLRTPTWGTLVIGMTSTAKTATTTVSPTSETDPI